MLYQVRKDRMVREKKLPQQFEVDHRHIYRFNAKYSSLIAKTPFDFSIKLVAARPYHPGNITCPSFERLKVVPTTLSWRVDNISELPGQRS